MHKYSYHSPFKVIFQPNLGRSLPRKPLVPPCGFPGHTYLLSIMALRGLAWITTYLGASGNSADLCLCAFVVSVFRTKAGLIPSNSLAGVVTELTAKHYDSFFCDDFWSRARRMKTSLIRSALGPYAEMIASVVEWRGYPQRRK